MPRDGQKVNARGWGGLLWDGCDVAILASGESLSPEQCEAVRAWRERDEHRKVIAINTTFRRALWADALYACDPQWWKGRDRTDSIRYVDEAKRDFAGSLWTQDAQAVKEHGLQHIPSKRGVGLERIVGLINQGSNSGYQAVGLAYHAGARTVYLLGFDMRGGHWHSPHPGMLNKNNAFPVYIKAFGQMAVDIEQVPGFDVINCTPGSALHCFPRKAWQEVFA